MWTYGHMGAGGPLHVCRRGNMEVWTSIALEPRCRRNDMDTWSAGGAL